MAHTTHTLDAKGKSLGRVASEAAKFLMGKHTATFTRYKPAEASVVIENAAKVRLSGKKGSAKEYVTYTGHPGGLREEPLSHLVARKGYREILRKAVYGMLPRNKLRPDMMKRLSISE